MQHQEKLDVNGYSLVYLTLIPLLTTLRNAEVLVRSFAIEHAVGYSRQSSLLAFILEEDIAHITF